MRLETPLPPGGGVPAGARGWRGGSDCKERVEHGVGRRPAWCFRSQAAWARLRGGGRRGTRLNWSMQIKLSRRGAGGFSGFVCSIWQDLLGGSGWRWVCLFENAVFGDSGWPADCGRGAA